MKYQRSSFRNVLIDTHHPKHFIVSDFLAVATILSVLSIVLETMPQLSGYSFWFLFVEWVTVVIFTTEYVLRLIAAPNKMKYAFSWFGIIDLVSILPTYVGLGNFTFLKAARVVRLMRLLRVMRITKMKNLKRHIEHEKQLSFYIVNVLLFVTLLVSATLISGILIYIVEGNRVAFESIPKGMWWAFRIFTNDPTFIQTDTVGGEVVYVFTRLIGLIVFGVLVGILGNVFKKVFFASK